MAFKPNVKKHLFETAHSGFYSGEQSGTVVNLLPKTWTKYTVTDGDWKEEYTIEPLVKRDIYLANMIDAIEYDKRHHYEASSHFVIDHEKKEMSVNPFDTTYEFENGLLYDPDRYYIHTETPPKLGGIENKLFFKDNLGLTYNIKVPEKQRYDIPEDFKPPDPIFEFSAFINDELINPEIYNDTMSGASIIVCTDLLEYDNTVKSGTWKCSSADYWDRLNNQRVVKHLSAVYGYYDDPANSADYIQDYGSVTGKDYDCFNPNDRTPTNTANQQINAGSNFISGDMDMAPVDALYIW